MSFPVEVLSARQPRGASERGTSRGISPRGGGTSPVSRRNLAECRTVMPAFPRAYSEVITHEQIMSQMPNRPRLESTQSWRGSPELTTRKVARHAETFRTIGPQPLPRAWSAVTWCNSNNFGSPNQNPTLLTSSSQREHSKDMKSSRSNFPQPPRAVVVCGRAKIPASTRPTGSSKGPSSPRPQRIIASPKATSSYSPPSTFSSLVGCGERKAPKAPAPINMPLSVRAQTSMSRQGQSHERPAVQEPPEYSVPSSDLEGLLRYLTGLDQKGLRITEAVYSVNTWMLYGLIPLRHHGFILYSEGSRSCGKDPYLTLDFSSRGILWDTFDVYPDVPEGTFFSKSYKIDLDPILVRDYCKATQPFSWPDNDCKHWAKGLLMMMGVSDDPCADGGIDHISRGHVGLREIITCGASQNSNRLIGCMP